MTAGIVGKQRQEGRRQGSEELLSSGQRVQLASAGPPSGAGPLAASPLRAVHISACCAHCIKWDVSFSSSVQCQLTSTLRAVPALACALST